MVLEKFEKKYYDDYISMSIDFFSSDAICGNAPLENFHNTFKQVINNSPLCDGYIILLDGIICGYTQLSFSWNNDFGGKVLWIEEIFIKSEFRSRGIGKEVMNTIYDMFKDDVKSFRLEVTSDNKALELYERIGYNLRGYLQYYKEV